MLKAVKIPKLRLKAHQDKNKIMLDMQTLGVKIERQATKNLWGKVKNPTGRLESSGRVITQELRNKVETRITFNTKYASYVEFGTRFFEGYSYLTDAVRQYKREWMNLITKTVKR
jgi:hypothetical protein